MEKIKPIDNSVTVTFKYLEQPCPQCHNTTLKLNKENVVVERTDEPGIYPVHCESCCQDNWLDVG